MLNDHDDRSRDDKSADPYQYHMPRDDRLYMMSSDSKYCDIDDVISGNDLQYFRNAMYCTLHLNIHSLPSKFDELKTKNAKKNLMLAEVYRIPNTPVRESLSRYDDLMNKLVASKCDIMLATDKNIDYCKSRF